MFIPLSQENELNLHLSYLHTEGSQRPCFRTRHTSRHSNFSIEFPDEGEDTNLWKKKFSR